MLVSRNVDFETFQEWHEYNKEHTTRIINLSSWLSGYRPSEDEQELKDHLSISREEIVKVFDRWVNDGLVCSATKKGKSSKQVQSDFKRGECALTTIEGLIVFTDNEALKMIICTAIDELIQSHRVGRLLDMQVYGAVKSQYEASKKVQAGELLRYDNFGGNIVLYIN
jgi:tellurite resistance protein